MKTLDEKIAEMRSKVKSEWRTRYELVETIQAAAIAVFAVEKESFFNGERTRSVAYSRMASMAVCREKTKLPLAIIATLHGGMDHGAVIYAVRKVKIGAKEDLDNGVKEILRIVGPECAPTTDPAPKSRFERARGKVEGK
jgi:chromosomal replication initiation ATPase DnaA